MSPRVVDLAVVVPTVNRPSMLARGLRSCFEGPCRPMEAIVVHDDPQHADRYANLYSELSSLPIKKIVHEKPKGPSAARNTGWREAASPWVYFLDDDDYLLTDGMGTIAQALRTCDAGVSVLAFGSRVLRGNQSRDELPGTVMLEYGVPFWAELGTLVIRKAALEEVDGFDPAISLGENRDLMARLASRFGVEYVDEPIVCLDYAHPSPRQSQQQGTIEANVHLLRKNEKIYRQDPLWWRTAHLYPACHAARRGDLRTSARLYREWLRSGGRLTDTRFMGALASSALSAARDAWASRSRRRRRGVETSRFSD